MRTACNGALQICCSTEQWFTAVCSTRSLTPPSSQHRMHEISRRLKTGYTCEAPEKRPKNWIAQELVSIVCTAFPHCLCKHLLCSTLLTPCSASIVSVSTAAVGWDRSEAHVLLPLPCDPNPTALPLNEFPLFCPVPSLQLSFCIMWWLPAA